MPMITPEALLIASGIFILRVLNYAITTIRTVAIARQQRVFSSVLAFVEALLFAVVIGSIVKDLENAINLMAYCLGAAVGGYLGMVLESRFITSYMTINIMAHDKGKAVAEALRAQGFGVTTITGEGRDGAVTMLRCVVMNRETGQVLAITREIDDKAFIAMEETRSIQHGWLRAPALYRRQGG